ncbi:hypothetical protein K439DRAFT_1625187 [Ramaria rubella]|nr:hypothetical protein K439DRAFT_1625187 [Ramaria rubella]
MSPNPYLGSKHDKSIALSLGGTPCSGDVHSPRDEAMDRSPWHIPVQTHRVSTNLKIEDPDLPARPVAGSSNQRDSGVMFSFGGTPLLDGVCGDKDDAMDSYPWLAPVQTRSVSSGRQVENLPKSSAACCLNIRDTAAASDSSGTSCKRDVGDPVKQGMSNSSCLPCASPICSVSAKVRSPLCWTSNDVIEATRDVNHVSNNTSAARIKSLPYRVSCEHDTENPIQDLSLERIVEPTDSPVSLCLRILQRSMSCLRLAGGEGQKMDDSPPFEVHVQQYVSSAKTEKSADSPSPASYRCDIIFHDVAASLESEATHSSVKNSDKHPSTCVMQETTVLVPSCSEAGKDSQSLLVNVSVPEGCRVGSSTSNLTEMSDGLLEQGGVVVDRNIPSTGRGSKPAVTAVEANVAGQSECTKGNKSRCSPISEHLRGITTLPSNGGGEFTGQRKELNISSTHPVDVPRNVSSSYQARHDTCVTSSDEVVSLTSSAVELNIRDSDECPSLPVDAP